VLADAGARVDEVDPGFADPVQAFHVLWFSGEAKALEPYGDTAHLMLDSGSVGYRRVTGAEWSRS
jgi:aspartyl-tRNA(Asn)/glutamyl-tRNA(Gln) amidotransferase subunit A